MIDLHHQPDRVYLPNSPFDVHKIYLEAVLLVLERGNDIAFIS